MAVYALHALCLRPAPLCRSGAAPASCQLWPCIALPSMHCSPRQCITVALPICLPTCPSAPQLPCLLSAWLTHPTRPPSCPPPAATFRTTSCTARCRPSYLRATRASHACGWTATGSAGRCQSSGGHPRWAAGRSGKGSGACGGPKLLSGGTVPLDTLEGQIEAAEGPRRKEVPPAKIAPA